MNWLMGDSGVRFDLVENVRGVGGMATSVANENGPGEDSGADRALRSDPESGNGGGGNGSLNGRQGQYKRQKNRGHERHIHSKPVVNF
jgi:hypothetical protein